MESRRRFKSEEFQEADIWESNKESKDSTFDVNDYTPSPFLTSRHLPNASMMIPRTQNPTQIEPMLTQNSAPVKVPDWSKIYAESPNKCYDDDDNDDDDGRLPPHEWVAKKHERNRILSSSVCEGAGRTLKGRDLSRVRNAVLTKTGFI